MFRTIIVILAAIVLIATPAFAEESNFTKAENFMKIGRYYDVISVLEAQIQLKSDDAKAYFMLGNIHLRLNNFAGADKEFLAAVTFKPSYKNKVSEIYRDQAIFRVNKGEIEKNKGEIENAKKLFFKAMEYQPALRKEIVQEFFSKGKAELSQGRINKADNYFSLAATFSILTVNFIKIHTNPALSDSISNIFFALGEKANEIESLPYYRRVKKYSVKHNETIKERFLAIARTKFEEKDITFWRQAAAEFGEIPPDYKVYEPGTYAFSLKAGKKTPFWITFPPGTLLVLSISSPDYQYKLLGYNGQVIKDGEDVVYPESIMGKFKIIAITDQPKITMVVKDKRLVVK